MRALPPVAAKESETILSVASAAAGWWIAWRDDSGEVLHPVIGLALVEAKWADGARVRVVFPMVACETGVELADGPEWGALCYYAPGHEPMPVWTADAPQ